MIKARHLVDELTAALREGELGLKTVPGLMKAVIKMGAWKEREIRGGKVVKFERFAEFLTATPPEGLGEQPALIKRLLHDDPETLAMFEGAMANPIGTNQHREGGSNPTTLDRGKAYTLRRLSKDRPDLFERVTAGELTANAAAVEAGFRKVKGPFEQVKVLWGKLTADQRTEFLAWVKDCP